LKKERIVKRFSIGVLLAVFIAMICAGFVSAQEPTPVCFYVERENGFNIECDYPIVLPTPTPEPIETPSVEPHEIELVLPSGGHADLFLTRFFRELLLDARNWNVQPIVDNRPVPPVEIEPDVLPSQSWYVPDEEEFNRRAQLFLDRFIHELALGITEYVQNWTPTPNP
jgi:hypothetical protein